MRNTTSPLSFLDIGNMPAEEFMMSYYYMMSYFHSKFADTLNEIFFRLYKCSSKFMYDPRRSFVDNFFIFRSLIPVKSFSSYQLGVQYFLSCILKHILYRLYILTGYNM
ncbi:hypothetical protein PBCV1_a327R [Paramecium bursaria Chlorella virus 1]|uniref:Uncharacterized protein n=1 Tax=Paramecium bursaria Chlorella virus 1 TaxID=10506 RepID=Q84641_PBCV1|nr:hypothetical protein PBCV1_a327R [Paramecium bursaria Chlorella virus 1]AAC96695.1 hypothetical protein [Paramecium bursaria Chlorella virus 1]